MHPTVKILNIHFFAIVNAVAVVCIEGQCWFDAEISTDFLFPLLLLLLPVVLYTVCLLIQIPSSLHIT